MSGALLNAFVHVFNSNPVLSIREADPFVAGLQSRPSTCSPGSGGGREEGRTAGD